MRAYRAPVLNIQAVAVGFRDLGFRGSLGLRGLGPYRASGFCFFFELGPQSSYSTATPLGPKYIPHNYMHPWGGIGFRDVGLGFRVQGV